jgi:hypothetical protein
VAAAAVMAAFAALADKKSETLLVLDWAAKAKGEKPPLAVLIEMGLKDKQPTDWSGQATVAGAKVVHREGYRFRKGDELLDPDSWKASSRRPIRVPPRNPQVSRMEGIATVGVVLHLGDVQPEATLALTRKGESSEKASVALKDVLSGKPQPLWDGAARVRLISTATPVVTAKTEDDFPAAAYGPDGTLWLAYVSYTLKDESRRIEQHPLKQQPADFKALYKPEFGDQLFVKSYRAGKWREPIAVTGPNEDLVRCAIAAEKDGTVSVLYGAHRDGTSNVYLRTVARQPKEGAEGRAEYRLGEEKRLTDAKDGFKPLSPVACTDQSGKMRWSHGGWYHLGPTGPDIGLSWGSALAAAPNGETAEAFDNYLSGDYDVRISRPIGMVVAGSSKFEARPSAAYDPQGRLWIAYEEGPEKWGKDYGALDSNNGQPLYSSRSVRVVCVQDGKLYRPATELPTSHVTPPSLPFGGLVGNRFEKATRYAYPRLGIDGKGRVWLTYRQKFGSRYSTHPGSYWLSFARRLDGDHWTEPIELNHSDGLLDSRPVVLPHASGGLLVIHNTDGRYTTPDTIDNQIYMSYVDLPGAPVEPKLVPHEAGEKDQKLVQNAEEERAAIRRLRAHRIEVGGKTYRPLRGDFHRHTEISWDGGPDGSLEDMFRYAVDAAGFDWVANSDHDNGGGREYPWWLTQKFTDAYHVKDRFTPPFCYERSVAYPQGHRNCLFAQRGVMTLPRLFEPVPKKRVGNVHPDDTKMLYRYLHELGGICASHTSATGMGTDWRDNDPKVEPIVEVYQGDRMSYEYEGAPRAGYDPKSDKKPANVAGWFPKGYIDHALKEKNYRLGFESSSDHWSTHISYSVVLAERHDRAAIIDALRQRHSYGATDNILLDVRSGEHLMGDEFRSGAAPALQFAVVGTKPLAKIDILRDSAVVHTVTPGKEEYKGEWTDPTPEAGVHYYYVRVQQTDNQMAWSSPMWIEYAK